MRKRTKSRECALKVLYAVEITKNSAEDCLADFFASQGVENKDVVSYARHLVLGVCEKKDFIDGLISKYSKNWNIKRMAAVDRNIMRMGSFEIIFENDVPVKVAINEAVEIAKKYGDKDSGKFVNGVLDRINKEEKDKR